MMCRLRGKIGFYGVPKCRSTRVVERSRDKSSSLPTTTGFRFLYSFSFLFVSFLSLSSFSLVEVSVQASGDEHRQLASDEER